MLEYLKLIYYLLNPKSIFLRRFSKGMGDNLLLTILLPHLKNKYPNSKIIIETEWPDLFTNNPYPDWVTTKHIKTTKKHIRPKYRINETTEVSLYNQIMSYVDIDKKGVPELFLTEDELSDIKKKYPGNYIVICPEGKQSFTANRKEWGFHNFQKLIKLLNDFTFVQIGSTNDKLLDGVIDARGLNIRESAALIKNSLLFVGLEGGLMHLTKAVGKRGVIIYGGFIKPEISGYDDFINIYNHVHCSPCFNSDKKHTSCETLECFRDITPEMVSEKILKGDVLDES